MIINDRLAVQVGICNAIKYFWNEIEQKKFFYTSATLTLSSLIGRRLPRMLEFQDWFPFEQRLHRFILCTRRPGGTTQNATSQLEFDLPSLTSFTFYFYCWILWKLVQMRFVKKGTFTTFVIFFISSHCVLCCNQSIYLKWRNPSIFMLLCAVSEAAGAGLV